MPDVARRTPVRRGLAGRKRRRSRYGTAKIIQMGAASRQNDSSNNRRQGYRSAKRGAENQTRLQERRYDLLPLIVWHVNGRSLGRTVPCRVTTLDGKRVHSIVRFS